MKWILGVCVFFISTVARAQNEEALVKAVRARLDKVADYTATGKMKLDVSFIKAPPSAVTVYYKNPDKFKVKKSDGISILPKGGVSINLGSLLGTTEYTVVPAGTAVVKGVNTKVVKLLPLDDASDVVLTTLFIDEKEKLIRKSVVTTKESGTYEMELEYGNYVSWGLPDKVLFLFSTKDYKLPKGITVEYEKGGVKKAPPVKNEKGKVEIVYTGYVINKGVSDEVFAAGK